MSTSSTSKNAITHGNVTKFNNLFTLGLRKSRLSGKKVQAVSKAQASALADEFVRLIRVYVQETSKMITRSAQVNRTRTPEEMLIATNPHELNIDTNCGMFPGRSVDIESVPRGEGSETEVVFFRAKLPEYFDTKYLDKEYALRGLVAADPYSLSAVNEADPSFSGKYPNVTYWGNSWREATYLHFFVSGNRGRVADMGVNWRSEYPPKYYWFAGHSK